MTTCMHWLSPPGSCSARARSASSRWSPAETPYDSGGAWETPLASSDGSVTFGTGNAYQSAAEAIAHPSPWLYTDSEVNLDAATGKLRRYYQRRDSGPQPHHGKVECDAKVPAYLLGAATVSNDLVFTTLYTGVLIALDRTTGAIVYQRTLPTSANAPIAIAGNSVLVPADGPSVFGPKGGSPQLVVYTVR